MDKNLFESGTAPQLSQETLARMTEMALSYRQHAPVNENKTRFGLGWFFTPVRASAFALAACVVIAFGMFGSMSANDIGLKTEAPVTTAAVEPAVDTDAYSEFTELAILDTLDSF
jgi:hypothetical protein